MFLPSQRFVFVAGLHRSGTSLVARALAGHSLVGAIAGAPVPEQEGVYLQGAIPHTARHGIPGAFAEDPAQHLTEGGRHDTGATRDRLAADWRPWFPEGPPWLVEKSPVNLTRMRLYQALFPLSQFVIVVRHPLATARATAKWSDRGEAALLAHWGTAYGLALADAGHLHAWVVVRYEDFCADPAAELARLAAFLDLTEIATPSGIADRNADYLDGPEPPLPEPAARLGYGGGAGRGPLRLGHHMLSRIAHPLGRRNLSGAAS